jgi:3-dehydroquinate synthetase
MELDKKARAGQLRFVLLDRIGAARVSSEYSAQRLQDILGEGSIVTAATADERPAVGK